MPEETKHVPAPAPEIPQIKPEPMTDTGNMQAVFSTMQRPPGATTPRGRSSSRGERSSQPKSIAQPLQNLPRFPHHNAYQPPMQPPIQQSMVPRYSDSNGMGSQPMNDTVPHNVQYPSQPPPVIPSLVFERIKPR